MNHRGTETQRHKDRRKRNAQRRVTVARPTGRAGRRWAEGSPETQIPGNPDLPCVRNASFIQFDAQCRLVERFEEARTEGAMHLDRRTDDALGEVVDLFELYASVPLW